MIPTKRHVQGLVLLQAALGAVLIVLAFIDTRWMPETLQQYHAESAKQEMTPSELVMSLIALPLLPMNIISLMQIYKFHRYGRKLYLISLLGMLVIVPFLGPDVETGFSAALGGFWMWVSGIMAALIHVPPLSQYFDPPIEGSNPGQPKQ